MQSKALRRHKRLQYQRNLCPANSVKSIMCARTPTRSGEIPNQLDRSLHSTRHRTIPSLSLHRHHLRSCQLPTLVGRSKNVAMRCQYRSVAGGRGDQKQFGGIIPPRVPFGRKSPTNRAASSRSQARQLQPRASLLHCQRPQRPVYTLSWSVPYARRPQPPVGWLGNGHNV
jgi:hypothetical protein